MNKYIDRFNQARKKRKTVTISCKCRVIYSGRAESELELGDRILLIKRDGTILIHQPTGNKPVNYMKPGTTSKMKKEEDNEKIILEGEDVGNKEKIKVFIKEIHFMEEKRLDDGKDIIVSGTEEDMVDMLLEEPDKIEEGFKPVSQEEQTKFGFIDILGVDKEGVMTVVECKRFSAGLSTVQQLRRYVEKIESSKGIDEIRGIVAAPRITDNAESMLEDWDFSFSYVEPPERLKEFSKDQKSLGEYS